LPSVKNIVGCGFYNFKIPIVSKKGYSIVTNIEVLKQYSSATKPTQLRFTCEDGSTSEWIFKVGDDLRVDIAIMSLFKLFNEMWACSCADLEFPPQALVYEALPLTSPSLSIDTKGSGLIECLSARSVADIERNNGWEEVRKYDPANKNKLLSSLVGGFVAGYVVGLRDRHQDNMLITNDYPFNFVHIDFGFIFGRETLIDSDIIAFPANLRKVLEEEGIWEEFLKLSCRAFILLRRMASIIQQVAVNTTSQLHNNPELISKWMSGAFFLEKTEDDAAALFRNILACQTWKTLMKNFLHEYKGVLQFFKEWTLLPHE